MKKFLLLLLGITFLAQTSEAQLVRSRTFAEKEKTGFNRITVGYDAMFLNHDFGTLNGVNLEYIHGFKIAKVPLFIEIGVGISYNAKDYNDEYIDRERYYYDQEYYYGDYYIDFHNRKLNSLSVRIPINVSYRFNVGEKFSIQPYTGLYFKINPLFYEYHGCKITELDNGRHSYYIDDSENKMFQWGWQIGVGLNLSRFYVGLLYGIDFLPRASVKRDLYTRIFDYIDGRPTTLGTYESHSKYEFKSTRFLLSVGVNF